MFRHVHPNSTPRQNFSNGTAHCHTEVQKDPQNLLVRGCHVLRNSGLKTFPTLVSIFIIHVSSSCSLFNRQIFTESLYSLYGPNCARHCTPREDKPAVRERCALGSWVGLGPWWAGTGSCWLTRVNCSIFRAVPSQLLKSVA